MGCCYSYEQEDDDNTRRAQPVYVIAGPAYTATRSNHDPHRNHFKPKPGALYGEYKCRCGYFWTSRLSWRDRYQECKRCHAQVRPRNQRELRPSDFKRGEDNERLEHPQHLCEMCKRVGGYCGRYNIYCRDELDAHHESWFEAAQEKNSWKELGEAFAQQ